MIEWASASSLDGGEDIWSHKAVELANGSSRPKMLATSSKGAQGGTDIDTDSNMATSNDSSIDYNSVDINELNDSPDSDSIRQTTSAILHFCKTKLLKPYFRLLGFVGLHPITEDRADWYSCVSVLGHLQTCFVILCLVAGYGLQYMSCYRRDRGFCYKFPMQPLYLIASREASYNEVCYGSFVFSFLFPSIIHFLGYVYSIYLFRISDNELLQNLIERVFLLSAYNPLDLSTRPKTLLYGLWFFIVLSLTWTLTSLGLVTALTIDADILFRWVEHWPVIYKMSLKGLIVFTTFWQDFVQATVVAAYCLQAQLLKYHLTFLRDRLLQHRIKPLDWMREMCEFRKLLRHLNKDVSPSVCLFSLLNISWAAAGLVWILNFDSIENERNNFYINISIVVLWILISMSPFIQAARLTSTCSTIKTAGHDIRMRPFVHQDTACEDLNTILLYTSSLKMSATLFRVPVTGRHLSLVFTLMAIVLMTLGMCHFLQS